VCGKNEKLKKAGKRGNYFGGIGRPFFGSTPREETTNYARGKQAKQHDPPRVYKFITGKHFKGGKKIEKGDGGK